MLRCDWSGKAGRRKAGCLKNHGYGDDAESYDKLVSVLFPELLAAAFGDKLIEEEQYLCVVVVHRLPSHGVGLVLHRVEPIGYAHFAQMLCYVLRAVHSATKEGHLVVGYLCVGVAVEEQGRSRGRIPLRRSAQREYRTCKRDYAGIVESFGE